LLAGALLYGESSLRGCLESCAEVGLPADGLGTGTGCLAALILGDIAAAAP